MKICKNYAHLFKKPNPQLTYMTQPADQQQPQRVCFGGGGVSSYPLSGHSQLMVRLSWTVTELGWSAIFCKFKFVTTYWLTGELQPAIA